MFYYLSPVHISYCPHPRLSLHLTLVGIAPSVTDTPSSLTFVTFSTPSVTPNWFSCIDQSLWKFQTHLSFPALSSAELGQPDVRCPQQLVCPCVPQLLGDPLSSGSTLYFAHYYATNKQRLCSGSFPRRYSFVTVYHLYVLF